MRLSVTTVALLAILLLLAACGPSQREQDLETEVSNLQGQVSSLSSDLADREAQETDLRTARCADRG